MTDKPQDLAQAKAALVAALLHTPEGQCIYKTLLRAAEALARVLDRLARKTA